jgi:putative hydrolase of the HAD superfamily
MSEPVDGVLFDLFETLITEHDPAWRPRPGPAVALGIDEATFARAWGKERKLHVRGDLTFQQTIERICHALSVDSQPDVIERLYQERLALKARALQGVEPEIVAMLDTLIRSSKRIGLVTNAGDAEVASFATSPLAHFFPDPVVSYQVHLLKPDPEIYALAARRLAIPANRIAFVGDGDSDELAGAEGAGMRAFRATWFSDRWPSTSARESRRAALSLHARVDRPQDLLRTLGVAN